jgi:hypothetical protein
MKIYRLSEFKRGMISGHKVWCVFANQMDFNNKLEFAVDDLDYQKTEDFVNSVHEQYVDILGNYYDEKRQVGSKMSWTVIPFARLKKIWTDYATMGFVRDERGMQSIVDKMIEILARLNASNDLAGHGRMSDEDIMDLTGYEIPDGNNYDFYFDFINTDYGVPVSDYGLPKLNDLAAKLMMARTSEQQLFYVDQMLSVVHQRGDLAALFIEGGWDSLQELKMQ